MSGSSGSGDGREVAGTGLPARTSGGWQPWSLAGRYLLLALTILAILLVTLMPAGFTSPWAGLCLICGERGLANLIGNVLLFLPLGVLLGAGRTRPVRIVLIVALFSSFIELTQHLIPGRNPNPTDILFNTLGGVLGLVLVRSRTYWLNAERAASARLGAVALGVALAVLALTGYLPRTSIPEREYFGEWTPDRDRLPWHPGEVLAAELAGTGIPSTRLEDGERVRELLDAGAPLDVRFTVGPSFGGRWPILRITDEADDVVALDVHQRWDDLFVRFRTRASAVRLHAPELRFRHAFAGAAVGDTVAIRISRDEAGQCVDVDGARHCERGLTLGRGWELLHALPPLRSAPLRRSVDAAWLVVLLLPVGFFAGSRRRAALAGAIIAGALLFVPAVTVLRPTPPFELAAALLGLLAGLALRRAARAGSEPSVLGQRSRPPRVPQRQREREHAGGQQRDRHRGEDEYIGGDVA
jgi:hypothetical protein